MEEMTPDPQTAVPSAKLPPARRKPRQAWLLLLLLPYLGLCFPTLYARATPALLGFPFFYWYQFAWVVATSCLLGLAYLKLRRPQ